MGQICNWFGVSRQAHYQMATRQQQQDTQEQRILELVRAIRQRHPRMGVRKVLHELRPGHWVPWMGNQTAEVFKAISPANEAFWGAISRLAGCFGNLCGLSH